ncbi:MAG: class I SAM-dependent methyltransferase [Terracidiphilus sp.]
MKEKLDSATCRFCKAELHHTFVDLGMSPLCESYLRPEELNEMEAFYPLHVFVCDQCFLVQLQEYVSPDRIFTEYAYFSSYSDSWLEHCRLYTGEMIERFALSTESLVVELASNDGYLLQYFAKKKIPVLGVEPAVNVAKVAVDRGIPTLVDFFGKRLAEEMVRTGKQADLLLGNNVLAQVPDLGDFVGGMKILLKPRGILTLEFPHLLQLMEGHQFDTIYHEHFSYFSFLAAERIFGAHNLVLFDVEELPTHGGSLRIFGRHREDASKPVTSRVTELRAREQAAGLMDVRTYGLFAESVKQTKRDLLDCLILAKQQRKSIAGYGAPGKGNTLLNYCGIRTDFLDYTVDRNPYKQGRFTPGTHIPIYSPGKIYETHPDFVLILPWNLKDEIMQQMELIREWGGKFIVPIPKATICAGPRPVAI